MHSGILWQVIYWSPIPILAALVIILLRRRLTREFPLFFSYVVVTCGKNVVQLVAYWEGAGNYKSPAYIYPYWFSQLASAVFILLATYELALTHLFPRYYKVTFYRYLFSIAALVVIGLVAFAMYGGSILPVLVKAVHLMDVLQVLAMFFFVALMQFMGRQWQRYQFAIALGLGVNSIGLVVYIVISLKSRIVFGVLQEILPIANTFAFLFWLFTFLRPEKPSAPPAAPISPEVLDEARKWQEGLKESLTRKKPAS